MKKIVICLNFFIFFICYGQTIKEKDLIPYRKGDLWGLANINSGEVLVTPVYDTVYYERSKGFIVKNNDKEGIVIAPTTKLDSIKIIPPIYDEVLEKVYRKNIEEGYLVKLNNKVGLLNKEGEVILPPEYSELYPFNDIYFWVIKEKGGALFDKDSQTFLTSFSYDTRYIEKETLDKKYAELLREEDDFLLEKEGEYYYINSDKVIKKFPVQITRNNFAYNVSANNIFEKMYPKVTVNSVIEAKDFFCDKELYVAKVLKTPKHKYSVIELCNNFGYTRIKEKKSGKFGLVNNMMLYQKMKKERKYELASVEEIGLEPMYDKIQYIKRNNYILFIPQINEKYKLYYKDHFISSVEYDKISWSREYDFALLEKDNKIGFAFITSDKESVIEPYFFIKGIEYIWEFPTHLKIFKVTDINKKSYFISDKGIVYFED